MSDGDAPAPVVHKEDEVPKQEPKAEVPAKQDEEQKPAPPSRPKSRKFVRVAVADDDESGDEEPAAAQPRVKREKADDEDEGFGLGGLALMGAAIVAFLSMK